LQKAWSQNLGHEKVLTTFSSYGEANTRRQDEIIRGLATPQLSVPADVTKRAKALAHEMRLLKSASNLTRHKSKSPVFAPNGSEMAV